MTKLDTYRKIPAGGGPRYPVLFWLTSPTREEHLHQLLRQEDGDVPTATATATTDTYPAEAVWLPGDGHDRVPLHQLPSFHGPDSAANPSFPGVGGALDLGGPDLT